MRVYMCVHKEDIGITVISRFKKKKKKADFHFIFFFPFHFIEFFVFFPTVIALSFQEGKRERERERG